MTRRERLREIIFEADTPAGKAFDVGLLVAILASIVAVMLESVASVRHQAGPLLRAAEWLFTLLFTAEYAARLAVVERPVRYARSFFGLVDLVSILPTYLSLILPGAQSLLVIRGLRLLRIFRVFKLARFLGEQNLLMTSLRLGSTKIYVFLATVLILDLILGTAMYVIEGAKSGFTSIPIAMYWAIVTTTTVGYGDIAPVTAGGQGDRLDRNAARLQHHRGADRHRDRRDHRRRPPPAEHTHLPALHERGAPARGALLPGLRGGAGGAVGVDRGPRDRRRPQYGKGRTLLDPALPYSGRKLADQRGRIRPSMSGIT